MFDSGDFGSHRSPSGLDPVVDVVGVPAEVYFSPEDRGDTRLVELLRNARASILFLAYSFTSDPLGEALLEQFAAGLEVRGVFDESQADGQGAEYGPLRQAGLDVRLDGNSGLMHHKVMVIDDEIVVLGSYNFTRAANQSNDENFIVLQDGGIAALYRAEFERIYSHGH
jgi:phosphatidylserine/phosphatidylglycerophosphate/cardiolipin synthase-like enzyme